MIRNKILIAASAAIVLSLFSCSYLKEVVPAKSVVLEKEKIDKAGNPALQSIMKKELGKKIVEIDNAVVKDIVVSSNMDYEYCVIVDIDTEKGKVECYLYSPSVKTVSKLVKGKTKIHAKGDFGRFFSTLDDYYTKIEIFDTSISIMDGVN